MLGLQLVPGILLAVGAAVLPASPRVLVWKGKIEDARAVLAKLRMRTQLEAHEDPLIQVRSGFFGSSSMLMKRRSNCWKCR